jgi:hypothetical protein
LPSNLPVTPAPSGQICGVLPSTDFFGNDIGFTYPVFSSDQCCLACNGNASCQAWTYINSTQVCFFKNGFGTVTINPDSILFYFFSQT